MGGQVQCKDGTPAVPPLLLTNQRKYIWLRMTQVSQQTCFQPQRQRSSKAAPWELVKGLDTKLCLPPRPPPPPPSLSCGPPTPVPDIEAQTYWELLAQVRQCVSDRAEIWTQGFPTTSSLLDSMGVQKESPQDVPPWYADCFEVKAALPTGSRETSASPF